MLFVSSWVYALLLVVLYVFCGVVVCLFGDVRVDDLLLRVLTGLVVGCLVYCCGWFIVTWLCYVGMCRRGAWYLFAVLVVCWAAWFACR